MRANKDYRASGRMFARPYTGANWGAGYRPNPIECNQCGDAILYCRMVLDPCKHGKTHNSILMNEKEVI